VGKERNLSSFRPSAIASTSNAEQKVDGQGARQGRKAELTGESNFLAEIPREEEEEGEGRREARSSCGRYARSGLSSSPAPFLLRRSSPNARNCLSLRRESEKKGKRSCSGELTFL